MYSIVDGVRLFFDIEGAGLVADGDRMREKPIVFALHGSFLDHSCFKPGLSELAKDCQLVYLDFRGFGRSDRSAAGHWTFERFSDDVIAIMDTLGVNKVVFLAYSSACHIAVALSQRYPERINANILMNPMFIKLDRFYGNLQEIGEHEAADVAKRVFEQRDMSAIEDFLEKVTPHFFQVQPSAELFVRSTMNLELFMHMLTQLLASDLVQELENVKVSTLICNGAKDPYNSPSISDQLRNNTKNSDMRVEVFDSSGHFILNDQPKAFLDVVSAYLATRV